MNTLSVESRRKRHGNMKQNNKLSNEEANEYRA